MKKVYLFLERTAWVRWVGVLPVALISLILSEFLFRLMYWVSSRFSGDWTGWMQDYIAPVISSGVGGYFYIIVGTTIAPYYKKYTGLILMLLLTAFTGILIFASAFAGKYLNMIQFISVLVGMIIAYIEIDEKE